MPLIYKFLFVLSFVLVIPVLVSAQTPDFIKNIQTQEDYDNLTPEQKFEEAEYYKDLQPFSGTQSGAPENSVSCFDYYKFGSVKVNLTPTLGQTVPGATVTFTGDIINENTYPVVDGSVYVKIFYIGKDGDAFASGQGYPVVDQFALPGTYVLPANGSKEAVFSWKVPTNAQGGEYMAAFYFQTAKRYNLLGLSFTDDVTGNQSQFTVTSKNVESVSFDKSKVTLNDKKHAFAAFPPHFIKDEVVKVATELTNYTDEEAVVPVTWKLYAWDALREEMLKDTATEYITLKARETKVLSYSAKPIDASVSYLVIEANDRGSKSILNVRWVRDGIDETRINFPSITKYPLTKDETNTLFSCLHSTNQSLVSDSVLTLTLQDKKGNVIHSYKYEGGVTSDMMGVKSDFLPERTFSNFTLTATLERGGVMVEEVSQTYDCNDIDPNRCADEVDEIKSIADGSSSPDYPNRTLILTLFIMAAIVLIGIIVFILIKNKNKGVETLSLLFSFVISGALLLGIPDGVEAKSVVSSVNNVPELAQDWVGTGSVYSTDTVPLSTTAWGAKWLIGLRAGASATVLYKTRLINNDNGVEIMDGSSVPVGTDIRVERIPAQNSDIFWNGTGAAYDTPYGYWVADAGPQSRACHEEDQTGVFPKTMRETWNSGPYLEANLISYTLLDVAPTVEQIASPSANLSCAGNVCTVTAAGPVSVAMNFPQTYGRFYYRYVDHPYHYGGGCRAKNAPMRVITGCSTNYDSCTSHGFLVEPNPYDLIIPAATINFSLTAAGPNTPPEAPTVTPDSPTGEQGVPLTLTVLGHDPDNDNIRYGFDWNNDGFVDEYAPAAGFVSSDTNQDLPHTWPIAGTYTIQVRTEDDRGAASSWTTKTVEIVLQPTATLSGTGCTISVGQSTCSGLLTWSIQNATLPNVYNFTRLVEYSTNVTGTNSSQLLQRGSNRIEARDGTNVVKYIHLQADCNSGLAYWNGGRCIPQPMINIVASSTVVRSGDTASVALKITSVVNLQCDLYGINITPEPQFTHLSGDTEKVYYYETRPLSSDQIIRLSCVSLDGFSETKELRIGVLGTMQEL